MINNICNIFNFDNDFVKMTRYINFRTKFGMLQNKLKPVNSTIYAKYNEYSVCVCVCVTTYILSYLIYALFD